MTFQTATAVIDCQALTHNFNKIKLLAPNSKILAVLKANGYGHGLALMAKNLPHADAFGVARIDEALELRASGIKQPIVLLEGFFSPTDLPVIVEHNLQTVIHNQKQRDVLCNTKLNQPIKIWLKIDTGMHRLGINPTEFHHYYQYLSCHTNVQQPLILMSHFSCADDTTNPATPNQFALFTQLTTNVVNEKSLANSAAILSRPNTHLDWIRPGLMLYGISPMSLAADGCNISGENIEKAHPEIDIIPVMTLKSSLISIRKIAAGETVGYGDTWLSKDNTIIGVVAIGYGDGYPRHAKNGTPVLINGRCVPLVGRVSMDMITVNLGENAQEQIGDSVTLWGQGLPVEEIARCAETIPYELVCNITRRVKVEMI